MILTQDALFIAAVIFFLRILNSAVGTVRLVVMARGQRLLVAVLGFIEALIFAYVTANVVTDLSNLLNLAAYCGGFALGIYVGMIIETRYVVSYIRVNIITQIGGHEIAVNLREHGYGVTEMQGQGGSGEVTMITSVVQRVDTGKVVSVAQQINPKAFITMEEARQVRHGWLRALRHTR